MPRSADQILEEALKLPAAERTWLVDKLIGDRGLMSDEAFTAWEKEAGPPEPGYDEWFRNRVEESLKDNSPGIPHQEAMKRFRQTIRRTRKLKKSA